MEENLLIRLATALDCEGYISIIKSPPTSTRKSPIYSLRVGLTMTTPDYVNALKDTFSGYLTYRQGRGECWKPQTDWGVTDLKAQACLILLLPYLWTKHKQAENALNFVTHRAGIKERHACNHKKGLSEDDLASYEEFYQTSRMLNKRGK